MQFFDLDDLAWPGVSALRPHVSAEIRAKVQSDDAILREMLGRWVSESEPSIAVRLGSGEIIGLTRADDPTGSVLVTPA